MSVVKSRFLLAESVAWLAFRGSFSLAKGDLWSTIFKFFNSLLSPVNV